MWSAYGQRFFSYRLPVQFWCSVAQRAAGPKAGQGTGSLTLRPRRRGDLTTSGQCRRPLPDGGSAACGAAGGGAGSGGAGGGAGSGGAGGAAAAHAGGAGGHADGRAEGGTTVA